MVARTRAWTPQSCQEQRDLLTQLREQRSKRIAEQQQQQQQQLHQQGVHAPKECRVLDSDEECDSEGFLVRPLRRGERGGSENDDGEVGGLGGRGLMNLHHDHNRDARRVCTMMVYLNELPSKEQGGMANRNYAHVSCSSDVASNVSSLVPTNVYRKEHSFVSHATGETFFPFAERRLDDPLLQRMQELQDKGLVILQHPEPGENIPR